MRINSIGVMPQVSNRKNQSNKDVSFGKFHSDVPEEGLRECVKKAIAAMNKAAGKNDAVEVRLKDRGNEITGVAGVTEEAVNFAGLQIGSVLFMHFDKKAPAREISSLSDDVVDFVHKETQNCLNLALLNRGGS